jgi:ureidoacrylate peracid hydrolase
MARIARAIGVADQLHHAFDVLSPLHAARLLRQNLVAGKICIKAFDIGNIIVLLNIPENDPMDEFSAHKLEAAVTLSPRRTAVLVVDMVNDFCKPGGAIVLPGYERLLLPQQTVIDAARHSDATVIFVVDSHRRNVRRDREFLKRTPHCIENSWGAEVIDELGARPEDLFVIKRRYSAFFNTDLDLTLRDLEIDALIVMGVVTNICVRSTVHDAFFLGYNVIVPEDCVAATGPREQESSLYDIATHFGAVADSRSVAAGLVERIAIENRIAA